MDSESRLGVFAASRFGVFVHFGLYSLLGRGEWALNREQIPLDEYRALADRFEAPAFDADDLVRLARRAGAKYLVFTTMHHDGFALYDSDVNPFNSVRLGCRRDLVAETVAACRRHGLRVHLYHSLNQWNRRPDGADALEDPAKAVEFVDYAHARVRELATRFNPIDCLWYDGWWPFDAQGWRAEEMNRMVRSIQPHILFNGRNGLPGDFATPEQHLGPPHPYRPWEACVTHNRSWGYHAGDHAWKSAADIVDMITQAAAGAGNLLLNIGPDGSGAIPPQSRRAFHEVGTWMERHGEAIYGSQPLTMSLRVRNEGDRGDWAHHGRYTAKGNTLYLHLLQWPGGDFSIGGVEGRALGARWVGGEASSVAIVQCGSRLSFGGLPVCPPHPLGGVLAVEFDRPPALYLTGGLRTPAAPHPRYDPVPSDLLG